MDQKEFEEKLTEVAYWTYEVNCETGSSKPLPAIDEDDIDEDDIDEEILEPTSKTIRIQQLKNQERPCTDCGKVVKNRLVQSKIVEKPFPHLQHKCTACTNYKNYFNSEFNVPFALKGEFFLFWYRHKDKAIEDLPSTKFNDLVKKRDK
jgi:hypothetical protein